MRLDRADVEWLLATHDDGRGPVDPADPGQRDRVGLDLRGADLGRARLAGLPLARTAGDATRPAGRAPTAEQRCRAAIRLRDAGRFFYRARVLRRQMPRLAGGRRAGASPASPALDGLTGYGERMGRMVAAYVALVAGFAARYRGLGGAGAAHIGWWQAAVPSATASHGRGFAAPLAPDGPRRAVAAAEAVAGFLVEGRCIAMLAQRVFGR
ncbi:MAG TPA: hypothetical protein VFL91_23985 [Thermomicrobiales bacterium]|nr:hypothetical protein [Thermomicrobiales bacterium]